MILWVHTFKGHRLHVQFACEQGVSHAPDVLHSAAGVAHVPDVLGKCSDKSNVVLVLFVCWNNRPPAGYFHERPEQLSGPAL